MSWQTANERLEHHPEVLVVDDDETINSQLARQFQSTQFDVTTASSGTEALEIARTHNFDVGIFDLFMPNMSGIELLKEINRFSPNFEAIILTGEANLETAIEAMKLGAYDYITKPCKLLELESIVKRAFERKRLKESNLKDNLADQQLIGESLPVNNMREEIKKLGPLDDPLLLIGDSGVGKRTVAAKLHSLSSRSSGPLFFTSSATSNDLSLESQIFGHEPDTFIGAVRREIGLLELGSNGTLFIHDIDRVSASLQAKLLQFLEHSEFQRIGGYQTIKSSARLIFSTTKDLWPLVKKGEFRDDLYYKLSTFTIKIASLKERKSDIGLIVENILQNEAARSNEPIKKLSKQGYSTLLEHGWPGNIRELQSVMKRACATSNENLIKHTDLSITSKRAKFENENREFATLDQVEKEHILYIFNRLNGNISKAAKILNVSRPKLYRKVKQYQNNLNSSNNQVEASKF
ncbi:MAG: sigma-54-dependent transcriptional regulator [Nitrospinota bacterium]